MKNHWLKRKEWKDTVHNNRMDGVISKPVCITLLSGVQTFWTMEEWNNSSREKKEELLPTVEVLTLSLWADLKEKEKEALTPTVRNKWQAMFG